MSFHSWRNWAYVNCDAHDIFEKLVETFKAIRLIGFRMVDLCAILCSIDKPDTSDTSPMMMEPTKSIHEETGLPRPPDTIELTGLEVLGIGLGLEDDSDDDDSCESYCADSVPCALRNNNNQRYQSSTTKESSKVAVKSCLLRPTQSRAMPRIILRRGSLASQLTDEEEDEDNEASLASLDSSESSHSINLLSYANPVQHAVPTTTTRSTKKRSHLQRLHSSATAPLHSSGYLMDNDISESHFVDFANDSVRLFASTHKHQHTAALLTFAPPATPQSEMGRAA
jgi:hypothetical protein